MADWKREIDETPEVKAATEDDVPRHWQPSSDTINAIRGQTDGTERREWIDKGIQDVPVDRVDLNDSHVQGEKDFKKVSKAEMQEGFEKLETTVRPAVDKGADGDYFSDLDRTQGLDYEHGYRRVYDSFYGNDAIRLDKAGDTYTVVNGYHRLAIAKEIGLTTVPAWVIERRD
jgi:hypothetical protein